MLDVGCGIGRTALAMTEFLSAPGSYSGLDVIDFAIRWCQSHIARRYPNFSFVHADVHNRAYNRRGRTPAERYSFPFEDASFTFSLASSLFTHLLPTATERYIAEVSRVLRAGGLFLSTWFLLDEVTDRGRATGNPVFRFAHEFAYHAQRSLHAPEQAVAYRADYVEKIFSDSGFVIESLRHGGWSGGMSEIDSAQDVIVARRT